MPALHPGDVRKLQAVDVPSLYHLLDVIAFPQKGKRPHPNEMAGSDLDGDLYFVTWHEDLILKQDSAPPMDFPSADETKLDHPITEGDIIDQLQFIVETDVVGKISRQHLIFADLEGIYSDRCLKLADLLAQVYDAPKTGLVLEWPPDLKTLKAPDFLEKGDHKLAYASKRILGKLYRHTRQILDDVKNAARASQQRVDEKSQLPWRPAYASSKAVAQRAEKLSRSYSSVMQTLIDDYQITSETSVLRAKLPNFQRSEDDHKKRAKLLRALDKLLKSMQRQCRSDVDDIGKTVAGTKDAICKALVWNCRNSGAHRYGTGLPLMLNCGHEGKLEDQDHSAYVAIGNRILLSVRRSSRIFVKSGSQVLAERAWRHGSIYLLLEQPWLLAAVAFLADKLGEFDQRTVEIVIHHAVHTSIKRDLISASDLTASTTKAGYFTRFLFSVSTYASKNMLSGKLAEFATHNRATDDEISRIGKLVVHSIWDVYSTYRNKPDNQSSDDLELTKVGAIQLLLKLALKLDVDADVEVQDSVEERTLAIARLKLRRGSEDVAAIVRAEFPEIYVACTDISPAKMKIVLRGPSSMLDECQRFFAKHKWIQ